MLGCSITSTFIRKKSSYMCFSVVQEDPGRWLLGLVISPTGSVSTSSELAPASRSYTVKVEGEVIGSDYV